MDPIPKVESNIYCAYVDYDPSYLKTWFLPTNLPLPTQQLQRLKKRFKRDRVDLKDQSKQHSTVR
ncbi:hypothetical protein F7725_017880 [Dissostichus mawsoni]|uniref:Uncharacterized protein n=1 Tax=Dissostichus mawsoni TaxID=36200 RepID=A0A7J5XQP6_DISMA|nr:hypothetical protein F7725_017880 [Dissostichus mawsoni]